LNKEAQIKLILKGAVAWNRTRRQTSFQPTLSGTDLNFQFANNRLFGRFRGIDLRGIDFSSADMSKVTLTGADLQDADFTNGI